MMGFLSLAGAWVKADRIELANGRIIEGIILRESAKGENEANLTIRVGNSQVTLPARQIKSLVRGTPVENRLIEAKRAIGARDYESAVLMMHEVHQDETGIEGVSVLLLNHADPLLKAFGTMKHESMQKLAAIIDSLDQVSLRYDRELTARRAQYYLALGMDEAARHQLGYLDEAWYMDHSLIRQWLVGQISNRAQELSGSADFEGALDHLRLLEHVDSAGMSGRLMQLRLQEARHLRSRNEFETALQFYIEQLIEETPDIARDRIRVTLEEAESFLRSRQELDKLEELARLIETYGLVHVPEFSRGRLGEIWLETGLLHVNNGRPEDAGRAFHRAGEYDPERAGRQLSLMDYRDRKLVLDAGDLVGHYELGVWAIEKNLFDEAETHFGIALDSELIGNNAKQYMETIRHMKAERELLKLIQLYEENAFTDVIEGLREFKQKQYPLGHLKQAIRLEQLVKEAIQLRAAERPQQAEALFQKAQRSYYSGHVDEAKHMLEAILTHYQNTVAYPRVMNFYTMLREKSILKGLEEGQPVKRGDLPTTATTSTGVELERIIHNMTWLEKAMN